MPDSGSESREELLRHLDGAEAVASKMKARAQQVAKEAAFTEGLAQAARPVIQSIPSDSSIPPQVWQDLKQAWRSYEELAKADWTVMAPRSSATTATASLTTAMASPLLSSYVTKGNAKAVETFRSFFHRPDLIDEVCAELRRFGLAEGKGGSRSALELINEGAAAQARAEPAVTGVLVPAREAILSAVAQLLQRRPRQEPASKTEQKVVSIGAQCGIGGLAADHFDLLGRGVAELLGRLSGAKQDDLERETVNELFDDALQFLKAFLLSLDPAKLR